jgi:hypothetical protein
MEPVFKYMFGVLFSDGTQYNQTYNDVSVQGEEAGSSFSDVVTRLNDVVLFQLAGCGNRFTVDLRDGHFEVNGIPVMVGDPTVTIPPNTKRKLVYFRRTTQTRETDVQCVGHDAEGKALYSPIGQRNVEHRVFHFGWQVEIGGRNHTVTMAVQ